MLSKTISCFEDNSWTTRSSVGECRHRNGDALASLLSHTMLATTSATNSWTILADSCCSSNMCLQRSALHSLRVVGNKTVSCSPNLRNPSTSGTTYDISRLTPTQPDYGQLATQTTLGRVTRDVKSRLKTHLFSTALSAFC